MRELSYLQPDWPAPASVRAASTFRTGGVSRGVYESLNLANHVGDEPRAVLENRRRITAALRLPSEPCWLEQIHSDRVVEAKNNSAPTKADASVACSANAVCAIMTADCLPVLLASRDGDCVAAAHAGWRGLAAGVLDNTVGSLNLPGSEIIAWLGPAIGPSAFEVGDEVRIAFLARDAGAAIAFRANARGRWQCDLYELARRNLARLGVIDVFGGDYCTFTDEPRFFSYRREMQRGITDGERENTGRMASFIWIENN